MSEENDSINYKAVVDQLQAENEQLRERLAQEHGAKFSPISDAIDTAIIVIKQSDPMHLYIWTCIICICISALVQVLEVLFK